MIAISAIVCNLNIISPLPTVAVIESAPSQPVVINAISGNISFTFPFPSVVVIEGDPDPEDPDPEDPEEPTDPPIPTNYILHGSNLSIFGIMAGRAPDSNIAIEGHLDFPERRNKTEHIWGDQNGVEPYVSAPEIMFNGRQITFHGYVKGGSRGDLDIKLLGFYDLLQSLAPNELMDFETNWGTFQVYVKGEIVTEVYRNNYSKITIPFYEPDPVLTGGTVPDNGDPEEITGIDGIDFDALGFTVVDFNGLGMKTTGLSGIFNRAAPQPQSAIGYFKEPWQVTKTGPKEFDLNAIIQTSNYAALKSTILNLYALFMTPGTRMLYLKGDRIRIVFVKKGFEVSHIRSRGFAKVKIQFTEGAEYEEDDNLLVLGDTVGNHVTTTTGQKILIKT